MGDGSEGALACEQRAVLGERCNWCSGRSVSLM